MSDSDCQSALIRCLQRQLPDNNTTWPSCRSVASSGRVLQGSARPRMSLLVHICYLVVVVLIATAPLSAEDMRAQVSDGHDGRLGAGNAPAVAVIQPDLGASVETRREPLHHQQGLVGKSAALGGKVGSGVGRLTGRALGTAVGVACVVIKDGAPVAAIAARLAGML
jgi:hypothetical protein